MEPGEDDDEHRREARPQRPAARAMIAGGRRRRLATRAVPVLLIAITAFGLGTLAGRGDAERSAGERFAAAWERGDFDAMYAELNPAARQEHSPAAFRRAYQEESRTATVESVSAESSGRMAGAGGATVEVLDAVIDTNAFGQVRGQMSLPLAGGGIGWAPHLTFPGLRPGETLARRTRIAPRAPILALDGRPLARGPAGSRSLPLEAAAAVVGELGEPVPRVARERKELGFPPGAPVGVSGLELAYERRLAGVPGGELIATRDADAPAQTARVLAATEPEPGKPVRTTIDPALQAAAVSALGAHYGGVAVLDAQRGAVRSLAGVAFSAPQPPGSTFKVITAVAALDTGVVDPSDEFPVEASNSEIGREISNSGDAPCGGTFGQSFANSCNTVFAPLGARVGGERLVATAEQFGFNSEPTLHGADATAAIDPPASTLPRQLSGSVAVGETALGQGEVLATPLQMASVAQTIANDGVRMPTPIVRGELAPAAEPVRVTSRETARIVRDLMTAVVSEGTGVAAALPGVEVAGKTGTAELGPAPLSGGPEAEQQLDAWFIAFAPARDPELAVAVMVVNAAGDGGVVAAPIAREVLAAALE